MFLVQISNNYKVRIQYQIFHASYIKFNNNFVRILILANFLPDSDSVKK